MDIYALAFSVSNLGPKSFQKLLNKFGTSQKAWVGNALDFNEVGIRGVAYKKFDTFRQSFNIENYVMQLDNAKVAFVSFSDKRYPKHLKKIDAPPIGLFVKGNIHLLSEKLSIGVVGTRKVTEYGREVTESLVRELVDKSGACIISGLALGVDGIAHGTAIEHKGSTIAILGCGVDCCLPSENYSIYTSILQNSGLIISEYPLSTPPNKGTFPARNRIIAALSVGVLVTEAAEGSGSLITADYALQYGKKVFAVPGQINSHTAKGSLGLIKKGAKIVISVEDILEELSIKNKLSSRIRNIKFTNLSTFEKNIIKILESEEMAIDELAHKSKTDVGSLMGIISVLELKGVIKNTRGKLSLIT